MNGSLVSIVVPAFNRAGVITETLESIARQTYREIECIVVDDGSADSTVAVVEEWGRQHAQFNLLLIRLERNAGKCAAVNRGLREAAGEFIMVLDSDDILMPETIDSEVDYLDRHREVGMVFGKAYLMEAGRKGSQIIGCFADEGEFNDLIERNGDLVLNGNAIIASTVLIRASVVYDVGEWRTDLKYIHDWDYWVRVAGKFKIGFLGRPVLYYRTNLHGSISSDRVGMFKETFRWLMEPSKSLGRKALYRVLFYQTKYFLWLSYHQGEPLDMMRIALHGLRVATGVVLG